MTHRIVRFRYLLLALAFTFASLLSQAQGPGDPGDPGPDPDPNPEIPFDGGLSLVIAAGVAYAAKKGFDKRKKLTKDESVES